MRVGGTEGAATLSSFQVSPNLYTVGTEEPKANNGMGNAKEGFVLVILCLQSDCVVKLTEL